MSVLIFLCVDEVSYFYTTFSFLVGGFTSIICGYAAMWIATQSNYRTTLETQKGLRYGFKCAYMAGCSMGFLVVSIALFNLSLLIALFIAIRC